MRLRGIASIALPAVVLVAALLPGAATAAVPQLLWQAPEDGGQGSGAGEVDRPTAVAIDQQSGHVYIPNGGTRIDEFTAWGEFVKGFGWSVDASNPEEKLQSCTADTGCKAGSSGSGSGQFGGTVMGLAVDSLGYVYVLDSSNNRVQKFDSDGNFVLMFGGEVNKSTNASICTAASGDTCGKGIVGTANGQFTWGGAFAERIAIAPSSDTIYVGDTDRVQIFDSQGTYVGEVGLPNDAEVKGGLPGGEGLSGALAVDPAGSLYLAFRRDFPHSMRPNIYRYAGGSWSLFAEVDAPVALAAAANGHLFVAYPSKSILTGSHDWDRIAEYDPAGDKLIPTAAEESDRDVEGYEVKENQFGRVEKTWIYGLATSSACGLATADIFATHLPFSLGISSLIAYGPTPDSSLCPPPVRPPEIADQFAPSVDSNEAILRARINSRFWPSTTYYLEYGTEPCSLGGCSKRPAAPGAALNSKGNSPVSTSNILLTGLQAGTTYHYRFVARTVYEPGPGGEAEVKGVGGKVGADGAEGTFTTPEPALPSKGDCPNQGFRTGGAAFLTDCRAYELVSPLDKGGDIASLISVTGFYARLNQSSISGDRFTYSTYRPAGGAPSAPTSSQYLADRVAGSGWAIQAISPSFGRTLVAGGSVSIDRQFKLFSPDLCRGWLRLDFEAPDPLLDPVAVPEMLNLYSRDNCGGGGYEALTTLVPPHRGATEYINLELQGTSADGQTAIYVAPDNLPGTDAPDIGSNGSPRLYIRGADGATRFVCLLPNGTPSAQPCSAGDTAGGQGRKSRLTGAISEDGSKVFFTTGGALYLRINATEPQSAVASGQCTEEEMACTIAIPAAKSFWAAAADGSRALFTTAGGALREYEVESANTTQIAASGTLGVMGQSEDATRVYFAANSVLAPGATLGKPNLYFREAGEPARFIATLAAPDVDSEGGPYAITPEPIYRAARVSPDGLSAAFLSRAPLTGFDNTDASSGEVLGEVFHYDATGGDTGEGSLVCVSCDPSGARQVGRVGPVSPWTVSRVAAWIPTWESSLYASNALSEDGSRLFFNSYVPLVVRDTNGKQDVYEWRSASGKAECESQGAERYVPASEGCLSLISSGESVLDSEFLDANPSSRDVFFTTGASLVSHDPGLIDVYDAREGGGLPAPPAPPAACEGEACQSPPEAPNDPTPASTVEGAGNVVETSPRKPRCAKGKARRKGRCVKAKAKSNRKAQERKRSNQNGRAGR